MKLDKPKIILFHPGKTGGTSLEHALRDKYLPNTTLNAKVANRDIMFGIDREFNVYLQHADIRLYNILQINLEEYDTIVTVRRPYERILSSYFYNGHSKTTDFESFVSKSLERRFLSSDRTYAKGHFASQACYYQYNDYTVNSVIHLENFKADLKKIGLSTPYHYAKTRKTKKYKSPLDAYTQKTKDVVYSIYKEDFKLFGYSK